jgi:hypothetical protein
MIATSRRQLLRTGGVVAAGIAVPAWLSREGWAAAPVVTGEALPERDDISHLLSRISFGVNPEEYELATGMGYEAYLDRQLDLEAIDDGALENRLAADLPTLGMSLAELLEWFRDRENRERRFQAFREFQFATIARAVYGKRQLFEVMVEFWGNHFAVNALDGPLTTFKPWEDREVMRRHALGRFRDLLQADAGSPAMLYYLDNVANVKDGPNENYSRELLELHTLGVDGGYTETDVQEVARIFTGWSVDRRTGGYRFYPFQHDYGSKVVLGTSFPAGRGRGEGVRLLDLLAGHDATATFIATKLARRFVSDIPPASVVDKVAETFATTKGDIRGTLRTLFLSDEFLASKDVKLKRPFEYVASALRSTAPEISQQGHAALYRTLRQLGQVPYGWPAPNGYPDVAPYWTSSSTMVHRWNFGLGLADGTLDRLYHLSVSGAGLPNSARGIVDTLIEHVLRRPVTEDDRATLIAHAAGGRDPGAWLPWNVRVATARGVLGLILVSRYFQLR